MNTPALNKTRCYLALVALLCLSSVKGQDRDSTVFLMAGCDLRIGGAAKLELHYKKIVPHRFSYQVKFGYGNTDLTNSVKSTPRNYLPYIQIQSELIAYTAKLGYIPIKVITDRGNIFTVALSGCLAYSLYNLDIHTKDPSYALYGDHIEEHRVTRILPGVECELYYAKRIFNRFYLNCALAGGLKHEHEVFEDLIIGNPYGSMVPGQASSKGPFYANVLIGLSFDLYPKKPEYTFSGNSPAIHARQDDNIKSNEHLQGED